MENARVPDQWMTAGEIESVLGQSDAEHRRLTEGWMEAIRQAELKNPDKERFDLVRLSSFYDIFDEAQEARVDFERDLKLEYRYWIFYPEVVSMREFAAVLIHVRASGES